MVRLKLTATYSLRQKRTRFQFQMVRLKLRRDALALQRLIEFQFQMVRLKYGIQGFRVPKSEVSIPNGSIKIANLLYTNASLMIGFNSKWFDLNMSKNHVLP